MRRILLLLVVFLASITTYLHNTSLASAQTSETSAKLTLTLKQTPKIQERDNRAKILKAYFTKYDSPLAEYSDVVIQEADKNNIDWKLIPAISGVESGFGKAIPVNSYNGWGFGIYGDHVLRFASWNEGIATVSKSLREDYMNRYKAKNVYEIGSIYAASPTWAYRVSNLMNQIGELEAETEQNTLSISL
jgi:hypothetical protein